MRSTDCTGPRCIAVWAIQFRRRACNGLCRTMHGFVPTPNRASCAQPTSLGVCHLSRKSRFTANALPPRARRRLERRSVTAAVSQQQVAPSAIICTSSRKPGARCSIVRCNFFSFVWRIPPSFAALVWSQVLAGGLMSHLGSTDYRKFGNRLQKWGPTDLEPCLTTRGHCSTS
jgi:hypothetical protein